MTDYSLAHLTAIVLPPLELIRVATQTDCPLLAATAGLAECLRHFGKGCAVAQGTRLGLHHRQVMQPVVNSAAEDVMRT